MYNMYNVIYANSDQIDKLYRKYMTGFRSIIVGTRYSYDSEDSIGFVTIWLISGKRISFQLRGEEPMFIEFTGFGNTRYDIAYPSKEHQKMYNKLKKWGNKIKTDFWKGAAI